MIITPEHFNPQETQPFFRYWLLAIGAQIGDDIPVYEYLIWNSEQVQDFKKSIGEQVQKPLCHIDSGIERFREYLKSLAEERSVQLALEI